MRRAYLMLEVGVCGALVATVLLGLMTALADARVNTILKNRDLVAQQIANDTLNTVRNRPFAAIASAPATRRLVGGGSYEVVVVVTPTSMSATLPSLSAYGGSGVVGSTTMTMPAKDIKVDVSFTPQHGGVRRAIASARVFGP